VNVSPFIAPSNAAGAPSPPWRSAATKVVVFHAPSGMRPIRRLPRGERPWLRAMLVEIAVSSINTRREASQFRHSLRHARRATTTSARSCSLACAAFF